MTDHQTQPASAVVADLDKLLPCPFCGAREASICERDHLHFVMCDNCTAEGPAMEGVESRLNAAAEWNRRAALARSAAPAPTEPVELAGIADQITGGAGFWHECSGCHETEDGHPVGNYPYSDAMRCYLGNGCSECGGIGAVWDNTDYEALGRAWVEEENAKFAAPAVEPSAEKVAAEVESYRRGYVEGMEEGARLAVEDSAGQVGQVASEQNLRDAAEALLEVLDGYHEQLVPINRKSTTVNWLRKALTAIDHPAPASTGRNALLDAMFAVRDHAEVQSDAELYKIAMSAILATVRRPAPATGGDLPEPHFLVDRGTGRIEPVYSAEQMHAFRNAGREPATDSAVTGDAAEMIDRLKEHVKHVHNPAGATGRLLIDATCMVEHLAKAIKHDTARELDVEAERLFDVWWNTPSATTGHPPRDVLEGFSAKAGFLAARSAAQGTAPAPAKELAHGHREDWYLMANARRIAQHPISMIRTMPNWALASELFATGSNSARKICQDAGIDPDSYTIGRAPSNNSPVGAKEQE